MLTTILIGNNLVNLSASALATKLTIQLFSSQAIGVSTGILTLIILIFSEVNPKRIAITYNEWITLRTASLIHVLSIILRPAIWFISGTSAVIGQFFKGKQHKKISMEGIFHMFSLAENEGVVEDYETNMIKNIFRFNDVQIHAIMTHRTDVFSLPKNKKIIESIPEITKHGFSRIPLYDDDEKEHIVGVALTRDIMKCVAGKDINKPLESIMVPPFFISEGRKVNELFLTFQKEKLNIAIVLDEYGGLAGIVTIEDAIEEILGEIYDEYELKENDKIYKIKKDHFRIQGDTSLELVQDVLGLSFEHEKHIQTIGGYLIETIGRFPHKKEKISLNKADFIIEEIKKHRIMQALCILKSEKQ